MFKRFTNACVRVVNRWLPDPFLFAIILTIIVFIGGMLGTKQGPIQMLSAWGNDAGIWGLLAFSMQMALVLVLGSAMASASICKKGLGMIARTATTKMRAILIVTFVSTICCWRPLTPALSSGTRVFPAPFRCSSVLKKEPRF